jgi:flagellar protein FlaI
MATDDADTPPSALEGEVQDGAEPADGAGSAPEAVVGSYTWDDFLREHGESAAAEALYERFEATPGSERWGEDEEERTLTPEDWERTDVDPAEYLGFSPWEIEARIGAAHRVAADITDYSALIGYEDTPVIKDIYGWEDYKREYFYTDEGVPPTDREGEPEEFDAEEALGFAPEAIDETMADCERAGEELTELIDERTVDIDEEVDEDAFFSDPQGRTTVANRYDLEKTVPQAKKSHFEEENRYWVNKPYSFVVIFHSTKENEIKYYVIQPHLTEIEQDLSEYLTDKLRASIKYEDEGTTAGDEAHRRSVIETKTRELLARYDLYEDPEEAGNRRRLGKSIAEKFGLDPHNGLSGRVIKLLGYDEPLDAVRQLEGIEVRPEPVLLEENADTLNEYQVEKLLYYLERDFIGYERIDGIKHDINVEDISCDGYNSPVFVYHSDYEQIITNVYHGEKELDDFVVKLAQRSGKGISKRRPQVDATLPDGSRAQLTLGREVSDHGTNYTIRQFKDVPFTPVDLINWQTFSLDEMAFLWLCIENHKSLIFAGGTASGKTTSLNAVSLFIPSNSKIVSIEDTREVELPQRNWIASVTRPSFSDDDKGDVDEFDLLEAALRQRPDYIVMGEIRGEEGRTLFQVMSTGHTTYTTFHADNVGEVLKRFTTEPINVSKTMFTALDLVSVQTSTRVQGHKVRRNKSLTEINHYDAENDEINVQDVYQWQAETDEFLKMGDSNTLDEIMFDRGWDHEKLDLEMFKRRTVLAYLIYNGLNTYTQVAATFQAFINDPETILSLMANDQLEASLEDLREMESVLIDIDPEKEEMVPRPDPNAEIMAEAKEILDEAEERLFEEYYGETPDEVADALVDTQPQGNVEATPDTAGELPAGADELAAADDDAAEIEEGEEDHAAIDDVDDGDSDEPTPELGSGDEAVDADQTVDEADETEAVDEPVDIDETPGGVDVGEGIEESASSDTEDDSTDPADIAETDDESPEPASTDLDNSSELDDSDTEDRSDENKADEDETTEIGVLPESDDEEATSDADSDPEALEGDTDDDSGDDSGDDPVIGDPLDADEEVSNTPEPDEFDPFGGDQDKEFVIGVPEEEMDAEPDEPSGADESDSDPEYTIGDPEPEQAEEPDEEPFDSASGAGSGDSIDAPAEEDDELQESEESGIDGSETDEPAFDDSDFEEPEYDDPNADEGELDVPESEEVESEGPTFDDSDFEEPEFDDPNADESELDEPESEEAESEGPAFDDSDFGEPEFDDPNADESELDETEPGEAESSERDIDETVPDESGTDDSDADETAFAEPDVDEPEFETPNTEERAVDESDLDESEVDESETSVPEVAEAESEEPDFERTDRDEPKPEETDRDEQEFDEPEFDFPEYDQPDDATIETAEDSATESGGEAETDAPEETNGEHTGWESTGSSSVDEGYTIRSPGEEDDEEEIDDEPSFDLSPDPAELTGDDDGDDQADLFGSDDDDEEDEVEIDSWKLEDEDDPWEGDE